MIKKIALALIGLAALATSAFAQTASDDYETGTIAYGYTGGIGYGALVKIVPGSTGGVYASNSATDGRQLDDLQSVGVYSGGGIEAAGRALTSPLTNGVFSVDVRWDISNNSNPFTGLNLASSIGTNFGDGELLSFGLIAGNNGQFLITDSGGTRFVNVGTDTELRGGIFNFSISFTNSNSYSLTVTDKGSGQFATTSGSFISTSSVGAFKVQNGDSDTGNQNLIFDNTTFTVVPEPSSLALLAGPALLGAFVYIRRRRS